MQTRPGAGASILGAPPPALCIRSWRPGTAQSPGSSVLSFLLLHQSWGLCEAHRGASPLPPLLEMPVGAPAPPGQPVTPPRRTFSPPVQLL